MTVRWKYRDGRGEFFFVEKRRVTVKWEYGDGRGGFIFFGVRAKRWMWRVGVGVARDIVTVWTGVIGGGFG